jgi:hypothetical protein
MKEKNLTFQFKEALSGSLIEWKKLLSAVCDSLEMLITFV